MKLVWIYVYICVCVGREKESAVCVCEGEKQECCMCVCVPAQQSFLVKNALLLGSSYFARFFNHWFFWTLLPTTQPLLSYLTTSLLFTYYLPIPFFFFFFYLPSSLKGSDGERKVNEFFFFLFKYLVSLVIDMPRTCLGGGAT